MTTPTIPPDNVAPGSSGHITHHNEISDALSYLLQQGGNTFQVANVMTAGAKGDGSADDTAVIQGVLDTAPSGSIVYVPPTPNGYKLTAPLTAPVSDKVSLVGAGWGSRLIFDGTLVSAAIKNPDTTARRFNVRWLRISQSNATPAGTAIEASYFVDSAFEHLLIDNYGSGTHPNIGISFNASGTYYNVVSDCRINAVGSGSMCVRLDNISNSNVIRNCRLIGDTAGNTKGIYCNTNGIVIDHVDMEAHGLIGIHIGASGKNITIINPYLELLTTGIQLESGSGPVTMLNGDFGGCTTEINDLGCKFFQAHNYWSKSFTQGASYGVLAGAPLAEDQGVPAWTYDPAMALQGGTGLPLNTVQLCKVILRRTATITNVVVLIQTAGATLTAGQNFAGLYNASGTLLSATADQATAWSTGGVGLKTMALTTQQVNLPAGTYYVALLANGTTAPQPARITGLNSSMLNLGLTAATARYATGPTGTTLPASITMASNAFSATAYWAAVS